MPRDNSNDVGYRKPPQSTQFKPGQSGNPKGRPKGSKNFSTLIAAELDQNLTINIGGLAKTVSTRAAIVKRMVHKALKGDRKALDWIEKHVPDAFAEEDIQNQEDIESLEKLNAMFKHLDEIRKRRRLNILLDRNVPENLIEELVPADALAQQNYDEKRKNLLEHGLSDEEIVEVLGKRPEDTGFSYDSVSWRFQFDNTAIDLGP